MRESTGELTREPVREPAREHGIVLSGTGGVWQILNDAGERRDASLRGRLKRGLTDQMKLAVGDRVFIEEDDRGGTWVIDSIESRTSVLARREPGGRYGERIVAANLDQVVVVFAAAQPEPHRRMLDRFLVIAEVNDLKARIVINKIDLVDESVVQERFGDYEALGYPLHFTSARENIGIDTLHDQLIGKVSALSGPSGVGKSSLINSMYPGLNLRVGAISESVNKGRHTTVGAVLHPIPEAGFIVDTPGLREVGMWGLDITQLDRCFPEFEPYLGECKYGDCSHRHEPGCAVREAVSAGEVNPLRYDSFVKLYDEIEETDRRWESK